MQPLASPLSDRNNVLLRIHSPQSHRITRTLEADDQTDGSSEAPCKFGSIPRILKQSFYRKGRNCADFRAMHCSRVMVRYQGEFIPNKDFSAGQRAVLNAFIGPLTIKRIQAPPVPACSNAPGHTWRMTSSFSFRSTWMSKGPAQMAEMAVPLILKAGIWQ